MATRKNPDIAYHSDCECGHPDCLGDEYAVAIRFYVEDMPLGEYTEDSIGVAPVELHDRFCAKLTALLTADYPHARVDCRVVGDKCGVLEVDWKNADGTVETLTNSGVQGETPRVCSECGCTVHPQRMPVYDLIESRYDDALRAVCADFVAEDEAEGPVWTVRDSATGQELIPELTYRLDAMAQADDYWHTVKAVAVRAVPVPFVSGASYYCRACCPVCASSDPEAFHLHGDTVCDRCATAAQDWTVIDPVTGANLVSNDYLSRAEAIEVADDLRWRVGGRGLGCDFATAARVGL